MILIFGSVFLNSYIETDNPAISDETISKAITHRLVPGGKGANQAFAATRSGAKVALACKVGSDPLTEAFLQKLRHAGVMTTAVGRSEDLPTGMQVYFNVSDQKHMKQVISAGANSQARAEQIPDEVLSEKTCVVIQTELPASENAALLRRAKNRGARTILNLSPSIDLSQSTLDDVDYLIVNHDQAVDLAKKIDIDADDDVDAAKLAEGLSKQGNLNCIITLSGKGTIAYTTKGQSWHIDALPVETVIDRSGAQDAYCGTLAACLDAGMPLPRALKRASIAGSLACTKPGEIESFPYLDDIDSRINEIPDPVQI